MTTSKPLEARTAIVTGASSGIGRAIAESLADAGAHVFLSGRTTSSLEESRWPRLVFRHRMRIVIPSRRDPTKWVQSRSPAPPDST